MIEVVRLTKRFKRPRSQRMDQDGRFIYALRDVSLRVAPGRVHGLVGPNGSGKSTLMRIIAGLTIQTSGSVLVNGEALGGARKRGNAIGYLPASGRLYPHLTVRENVEFFARLADVDSANRRELALETLVSLGCSEYADTYPSELSFGTYQKARLARLLVTNPKVMLLDEPSTGVDIVGIRQLRIIVEQLSSLGIPVIMATHNVAEIAAFCDSVTVLSKGAVRFSGSLPELSKGTEKADLGDAIFQLIQPQGT